MSKVVIFCFLIKITLTRFKGCDLLFYSYVACELLISNLHYFQNIKAKHIKYMKVLKMSDFHQLIQVLQHQPTVKNKILNWLLLSEICLKYLLP